MVQFESERTRRSVLQVLGGALTPVFTDQFVDENSERESLSVQSLLRIGYEFDDRFQFAGFEYGQFPATRLSFGSEQDQLECITGIYRRKDHLHTVDIGLLRPTRDSLSSVSIRTLYDAWVDRERLRETDSEKGSNENEGLGMVFQFDDWHTETIVQGYPRITYGFPRSAEPNTTRQYTLTVQMLPEGVLKAAELTRPNDSVPELGGRYATAVLRKVQKHDITVDPAALEAVQA